MDAIDALVDLAFRLVEFEANLDYSGLPFDKLGVFVGYYNGVIENSKIDKELFEANIVVQLSPLDDSLNLVLGFPYDYKITSNIKPDVISENLRYLVETLDDDDAKKRVYVKVGPIIHSLATIARILPNYNCQTGETDTTNLTDIITKEMSLLAGLGLEVSSGFQEITGLRQNEHTKTKLLVLNKHKPINLRNSPLFFATSLLLFYLATQHPMLEYRKLIYVTQAYFESTTADYTLTPYVLQSLKEVYAIMATSVYSFALGTVGLARGIKEKLSK